MFLYLGEGKYKRLSDVIGIFDMDSATVCVATRRFLSAKEREGSVESDGELPKSFLLCDKREEGYKDQGKRSKSPKKQKKQTVAVLSKLASSVLAARTAKVKEGQTEEEVL